MRLLQAKGRYSRAFAARGLGRLKHAAAAKSLHALLEPSAKAGLEVTVSVIRALAQVGATDAAPALARIAGDPKADSNVRLEAVTALGELRSPEGLATAQDLMTDEWPALRAAGLRAAAAIDQDSFVAVLAGMEQDRNWRVRAALADVLGSLPPELVGVRLRSMLDDDDKRVIPSVIGSLARMKVPEIRAIAMARLADSDPAVRVAAVNALGTNKAEGNADALRQAYKTAIGDETYDVRTAVLQALVSYGPAEATPALREALTDKDWAVRVRAQELLAKVDPQAEIPSIAPVPNTPIASYEDPGLIAPSNSPHVFLETEYGTIEFQLAVLDAPQTTRNFIELVKKGYFNGLEVHRVVANFVVQDGDSRGDGSGGPGYTIRDELNDRPYLRGTVGMALQWRDTGGSQFFITHSPQPRLDARYTSFGHVVNGLDVLDRIRPGDRIVRVRVWDGTKWQN
jgi:cyclophilin family peptidyl-prolyl cis-trans isomerase/HEAT repeat protein